MMRSLFPSCHGIETKLTKGTILDVEDAREHEQHFHGRIPNHLFNVIPEDLAAQELGQVAPNLVALVRKLQREPQREFIVFGICVIKKKRLPLWCGRCCRFAQDTTH